MLLVAIAFAGWNIALALSGIFGGAGSAGGSDSTGATQPAGSQIKEQAPKGPGDIVIGVNGDEDTYVLKGEEYLEAGAHAAEPKDGVLTSKIETKGAVDTAKAGDYKVTYTVKDSSGHEASIERTVHVVESMDTMKVGVPVLMYHYVYDPANPPATIDGNHLEKSKFEAQLQYLSQNNFYYPSYQEVQAFIQGKHSLPAKSVVLTFDDGEAGFLNVGVPLLEKYKVPATSFIIASDADATQKVVEHRNRYVQYQSHSFNMHRAGGNVGHGGIISAMTHDQIVEDLKKSEEIVGAHDAFAYPFGDTTDDAKSAVADAGFLCGFTTKNAWAKIGDDVRTLPRVRISGEYTQASFEALVNG